MLSACTKLGTHSYSGLVRDSARPCTALGQHTAACVCAYCSQAALHEGPCSNTIKISNKFNTDIFAIVLWQSGFIMFILHEHAPALFSPVQHSADVFSNT